MRGRPPPRRLSGRQFSRSRNLRIGLFGLLGSGNIGNDGSLESVLDFIAAEQPDAVVGCLCAGAESVARRYGIDATALHWYSQSERDYPAVALAACKAFGKVVDAFRTLSWVRRFDVVIVPGAGVLETTLPLRPWGFPYALFLLCACGRLTGTKVALLNVGASFTSKRVTRMLFRSSARLAHYLSYRDATSASAMRAMGMASARDEIYPDLVFALPTVQGKQPEPGTVGVGVMDFPGGNDDRRAADGIRSSYLAAMKRFVGWLVRTGHRVQLFGGDEIDDAIAAEVRDTVLAQHLDVQPSRIVVQPVSSFTDLMAQMSAVETVVATRYHNVLCALKLAKPTLSVSYSTKSDDAMSQWGLARFCHPARAVRVDKLIEQFSELEGRAHELREVLRARTAAQQELLRTQRVVLSSTLFGVSKDRGTTPDGAQEAV